MPAVDNKHLIEILVVNESNGVSKKSGQPWRMFRAQCIVRGPDNSVQIGELNLPDALSKTPPGKYLAEFELGVNFERLVVPRITALHAYGETASKPIPKAPVQSA